ncbi:MAG: ATP-binding cassette domain-containing protein [Bacteroidaceae bacterium]|nr:ATP-binding cassette domain-containing protein [Bacteroidaceae bacterium]
MQTIRLNRLLPHVFLERKDSLQSDVWLQDLTLSRGKSYLVEAMSGTGKSSLCAYLIGYRNDFDGQILFDDTDASRLTTAQWTQLRVQTFAYLFQELRLFPELTALENIEIKNRLTQHKSAAWIDQAFERLGIAEKRHTKIGRMSFGQQQRVAFIRAMVQPADFILLDEPVSHLDDANAQAMAQLLTEEQQVSGAAVIVTSIGKHLPIHYDHTLHL